MEKKLIDPASIPGWGIDADPKDQPNYPIKKYTGDDHKRSNWQRPALQQTDVEILKSTERPMLSAVFGTSNPPRLISGLLRRFAFKYSENMYRHWLPLLLADRVDVVESEIEELLHARVSNPVAERGWGAISEHNAPLMSRKILVRIGIFLAIAALIAYRSEKSGSQLKET